MGEEKNNLEESVTGRDEIVRDILRGVNAATQIHLRKAGLPQLEILRQREEQLTYNLLEVYERLSVEGPSLFTYGPLQWERHHGLRFPDWQKELLKVLPVDERTLDSWCPFNPGKCIRDTHGMIAAPDHTTLMALYQRYGAECFFSFQKKPFYQKEAFAKEVEIPFGWHFVLLEMKPFFFTRGITLKDLVEMLPPKYSLMPAVLEVFKDLAVLDATGEYSSADFEAITSDCIKDPSGSAQHQRIRINNLPGQGVRITHGWEGGVLDWRAVPALERKVDLPTFGRVGVNIFKD